MRCKIMKFPFEADQINVNKQTNEQVDRVKFNELQASMDKSVSKKRQSLVMQASTVDRKN